MILIVPRLVVYYCFGTWCETCFLLSSIFISKKQLGCKYVGRLKSPNRRSGGWTGFPVKLVQTYS